MKKWMIFALGTFVAVAASGTYVWHTKYSNTARLESVIKARLNDPASAVFGEWKQSKTDPLTWCGSVNSRNRMGGMVGFTGVIVKLENFKDKYGLPDIQDDDVLAEVTFNSPESAVQFFTAAHKHCIMKN